MTFLEYLQSRRELILAQTLEHANIVLMSVALATVIAVLIALATYRNPSARATATGTAAALLTIPSFALLGLLITPLGLGYTPTLVALTMYALLPILRNTIVGLTEIDPALTEAARGIGMGRLRSLATVEIPLAWPVILAGIRVSTQMTMGIAAIAAYVDGPGLGHQIFSGLANLGGVNSLNQALVGTVGVIVLAVVFDLALALLGRLTRAGQRPKLFRARPTRRPALTPTTAVPSPSLGGRE
ncbi:ABC transporter permease [Salinispora arenicola]|uniref:ABC transporter permease n=1 Tax=Salinispora arenicola TaxID=168697 RepID=A0A542XUG5_SALAC|nr:ABC transporter permease [Salinispora arenicola]MCN0154030.1 ABC transporter permease [Salinispora arenicola]TQL39485.1 osmoprotectant transport system permease protein [Salinispora arenicola]GIM86532.1 ABC transporter permease [Salinispora arenicola]